MGKRKVGNDTNKCRVRRETTLQILQEISNYWWCLNLVCCVLFPLQVKRHWLGENYNRPGAEGNDVTKTNTPDIRVAFRHETLSEELATLCKAAKSDWSPSCTTEILFSWVQNSSWILKFRSILICSTQNSYLWKLKLIFKFYQQLFLPIFLTFN